jgi:hypothetical protein
MGPPGLMAIGTVAIPGLIGMPAAPPGAGIAGALAIGGTPLPSKLTTAGGRVAPNAWYEGTAGEGS